MKNFYKYFLEIFLITYFITPSFSLSQELNVNNVMLRFTNDGGLNENGGIQSFWQGTDGTNFEYLVWNQGLWITGKRNNGYGWVPYLWRSSYSPGPIINGMPALKTNFQDSARYRVYTITRGDSSASNSDFSVWPVDLGAPTDISGKPKIYGDQTTWSVYNGADTTLVDYLFQNRRLLPRVLFPVEVRQTSFEHFGEPGDTSIWANSIFFEWSIFNKGIDPLDSVYLTFWTDIDMNIFYSRDIPAIDTVAQTGYCWRRNDSSYSCAGYTLLYGPAISSLGDTAVFFGKKKIGYKNLPLSSFWPVQDDSYSDSSPIGPPYSMTTAWNLVRGFTKNGEPIIDSITKLPTKFPCSGDPITRLGSLNPLVGIGGGAGFMMTTGPITIAPGDSQWIMIALIPSIKLNNVDAINRMRTNAQYLKSLPYDSLTSHKPRRDVPIKPLPNFPSPSTFRLYSNYPNPFNNETTISFDLPERSNVHIEIFDALGRTITSLTPRIFEEGNQIVRWFPAVSAGVYFVRVNATSLESSAKWNGFNKVVLIK